MYNFRRFLYMSVWICITDIHIRFVGLTPFNFPQACLSPFSLTFSQSAFVLCELQCLLEQNVSDTIQSRPPDVVLTLSLLCLPLTVHAVLETVPRNESALCHPPISACRARLVSISSFAIRSRIEAWHGNGEHQHTRSLPLSGVNQFSS